MGSKPKSSQALQKASALTTRSRILPPEWEMDSYGHFFGEKYGLESKTGKEIGKAMRDCEEKCAMAKLEMYAKIQEIIKEAHKKPQVLLKPLKPPKSSKSSK